MDDNQDNICDRCAYEMTRFSVTVPTSLQIAMSPRRGRFYRRRGRYRQPLHRSREGQQPPGENRQRLDAGALRHGYGAPEGGRKNHWLLHCRYPRPRKTGTTESLTLDSRWTIPQDGSLALPYDAVVSACSQPVQEQVMTLVFVLEWA